MDSVKLLENVMKCLNDFVQEIQLPSSLIKVSMNFDDYDSLNLPEDMSQLVKQLSESIQGTMEHTNSTSKNRIQDHNLVQITASKAQLDQRIAAFISHAQNAIDEQNVQEFCSKNDANVLQDGCARTHALYRRRPSNRSHLQVNRTKNNEGPQMQVNSQGIWCAALRETNKSNSISDCPDGIKERLHNLEDHTGLNRSSAPRDIYARLKQLEDRVLELESMSPEYFHSNATPPISRRSSTEDKQHTTLVEIDDRIQYLKQKLLNKKFKAG